MKIASALRVVRDRVQSAGARASYWNAAKLATEARALLTHADPSVRSHFQNDLKRFLRGSVSPVRGEIVKRARAAADWLLRAQASTPDDGVSLGYFPCDPIYHGWRPSYPETTGYIMTTLFEFARLFGDAAARDAALRMGRWEVAVQMASGAVQGGPIASPEKQTAAAFNTGMVLDGWCSAYEVAHDLVFLEAGRRAADFLADDMDESGHFKTNGDFVSAGETKTYTCLCGWAMFRFGVLAAEPRFCEAAIRCVQAAVRVQRANGWFPNNCLSNSRSPLTHTIGYTLQAILEVGLLAGRQDFIEAAKRGVDPLIAQIDDVGFLSGRFYADWQPATFSSCLTGSAQIAIVCYRLYDTTGNTNYICAANKLLDFLKGLQLIDSPNQGLNGALAGSFPFMGEYMRAGYPNWATKYFLDALMLQHKHART